MFVLESRPVSWKQRIYLQAALFFFIGSPQQTRSIVPQSQSRSMVTNSPQSMQPYRVPAREAVLGAALVFAGALTAVLAGAFDAILAGALAIFLVLLVFFRAVAMIIASLVQVFDNSITIFKILSSTYLKKIFSLPIINK
jgi:hypothetical protein